jgi:hypothetical protein
MMELWSVENADSSSHCSNRVRSKGVSSLRSSCCWSYCCSSSSSCGQSAKVTLRESLRGRDMAEVETAGIFVFIFILALALDLALALALDLALALEVPAINCFINGS